MATRYETKGVQAEFEPGSRGRVLRNLLGIIRARDMALAESQALALAVVHGELILIHPFREGNGRLARLVVVLMGLQAGLPPLDFSPLQGRGKLHYFAGIQAAMSNNYQPLKEMFEKVIDRTWKYAASSSR